jgi:hypothetical protein
MFYCFSVLFYSRQIGSLPTAVNIEQLITVASSKVTVSAIYENKSGRTMKISVSRNLRAIITA